MMPSSSVVVKVKDSSWWIKSGHINGNKGIQNSAVIYAFNCGYSKNIPEDFMIISLKMIISWNI